MRSIFLPLTLILLGANLSIGSNIMVMGHLQAAEVAKVPERELRQLFPGQFHAIARGLIRVNITARADGSLIAQQIGKSDTGTWNIRSDQLCITFTKWLKGRTRCSTVTEKAGWYRTSDVTFKKVDGTALAAP